MTARAAADSRRIGLCEDARSGLGIPDAGCCMTCHEEADDYGMAMHYIDAPGGFYEVCCRTYEAWDAAGRPKRPGVSS